MRVALVMTVKNEERLLLQNIHYHKGIGISDIFVYFDNTTDDGEKLIESIEGVSVHKSVEAKKYMHLPYLEKFWKNAEEHHTARQCLNTYDALEKCKQKEIDWLISLDADELFLTDIKGASSISDFFNDYSSDIDVIQLKPLEVIARRFSYSQVMGEETYFKTKKNFKSKLDQLYRKIYNPYTHKYITTSYWLGHTMGKAAINVNSDVIPHNVHKYRSISGHKKINKIRKGFLLHYHLYDFQDFIKKYMNFKDHPPAFLSGNSIEYLKTLYIKLVNDPSFSEEMLKEYYKNNLQFNSKEISKLKKTRLFNLVPRKEKAIIEIEYPKKVLTNFKTT